MKLNELVSIHEEHFDAIVQSLEQIAQAMQSNTYVRTTTKSLQQLLSDVRRNPIVLVVGKEGVGKTSVVNAYLREPVLCSREQERTKVHTLVQYGKEQHIEAAFMDGVDAVFELSKLELLTVADRFAANLLREQMEILSVSVDNPYVELISFIDARAFDVTSTSNYYISDAIMQRIDDVFYVIRADAQVSDEEITWLQLLNECFHMKPVCIVNFSDKPHENHENIAPYVRDIRYVNAKQLLQIADRAPNDAQFAPLDEAVAEVIQKSTLRSQKFARRLFRWLERFTLEIESLLEREPLKLAAEFAHTDVEEQQQIQKRNQAILEEYELEYESYSSLLEPIQTLFQFVRLIETRDYLLTPDTIVFTRVASDYQQVLREYRQKYSEYQELMKKLQQHTEARQKGGFVLIRKLFKEGADQTFDVQKAINQLNLQRSLLELIHERIRTTETQLLESFPRIHRIIESLVEHRANSALKKIQHFKSSQQRDMRTFMFATRKLNEFDGVREAQQLVSMLIADLVLQDSFTDAQRERLQNWYQRIVAVEILQNDETMQANVLEDLEIDKAYAPFQKLNLSIDMLRSDYPDVPTIMKLEDVKSEL